MLLIEFSRSEVDPSSLSNENKYHYLGIQNKYRKGKVEYRVPSAISAWISQRCIIVIFKLFKKVWRTTKTSHLPFYLFSVNKKLTFASHSWWKKCTLPQMIPNRKWSRDHKWSPKWTANDPRPQVIPKVDRKWSRENLRNGMDFMGLITKKDWL